MQQVRLALAGMLLALSAISSFAQERPTLQSLTFDPKLMLECPGVRPQGTPWQLPNVGVAPLAKTVPGMNAVEIARLFRGLEPTDVVSEEQRTALMIDREGLRMAAAYHFLTPVGQSFDQGPQEPTDELWGRIVKAMEHAQIETLPCGYQLQGDLFYATEVLWRGSKPKVRISGLKAPVYIWWSYQGYATPDGTPGVPAWVSAPFESPKDGKYNGALVQLVIPGCGNMTIRLAPIFETTAVTAPMPVIPPEEKSKSVVPPPSSLPPLEPAAIQPEIPPSSGRGFRPCRGNWKYVCIAAAASPLLLLRTGSTPSGPAQPGKSGGPGGR